MTLSARLWADNGDLAAAALAHPFVSRPRRRLAAP